MCLCDEQQCVFFGGEQSFFACQDSFFSDTSLSVSLFSEFNLPISHHTQAKRKRPVPIFGAVINRLQFVLPT